MPGIGGRIPVAQHGLQEGWQRLRRLRARYLWSRLVHARRFPEVRVFCLFVGYPRSGHSIVGALINAHRDAVIAHEADAPALILRGASRDELFARLLARASWFHARRHRSNYPYEVPGSWQGRFRTLQVLGDKKGGAVSRAAAAHPDFLERARALVGVPLRLLHVVRNPYDNIAAIARWDAKSLPAAADYYFQHAASAFAIARARTPAELLTLRHEELIRDPRAVLRRLTAFLGLEIYPGYLDACAAVVFEQPTRSRFAARWTPDLLRQVAERAAAFPFLADYTYEEGETVAAPRNEVVSP